MNFTVEKKVLERRLFPRTLVKDIKVYAEAKNERV